MLVCLGGRERQAVTPLNDARCKVLVLSAHDRYGRAMDALRSTCEVVEMTSIDQAIDALRSDHFSAIFSDSADFLPLERALVSQQANRSEEHTSELQSRQYLVCRLLLEKKKPTLYNSIPISQH